MPRPTAEERFAAKVDRNGPMSLYRGAPGPCHLWTGGARSKREHDAGQYGEFYGTFRVDGRTVRAHRYAYELAYGPLPEPVEDDNEPRLELDHRCRRRNCVNAAHLEVVDHRTNTLRSTAPTAANARKTHCHAGHPFDDANTYRDRHGHRHCRACRRNRDQQPATVATLPAPTLERQAA